MLLLKDILNLKNLNNLVEEHYISMKENPDMSGMYILKYTKKTQLEGNWNNETMICRGLIVQTDGGNLNNSTIVVERPFKKFFTVEQLDGVWGIDDLTLIDDGVELPKLSETIGETIELDQEARVYDKVDGCLLISYYNDDNLCFSTSGSFKSDEAIFFNKFFKDNYNALEISNNLKGLHDRYTFLFEGLSSNIHVIKYKEDIRFLGAIERASGRYVAPCDFEGIELIKSSFKVVERLQASSLREALELPERVGVEGFVVSTIGEGDQHLYKYKCPAYCIFRFLLRKPVSTIYTPLSEYIYNGDDFSYKEILGLTEYWDQFDGNTKAHIENVYNKIVDHYNGLVNEAEEIVAKSRELYNPEDASERKKFYMENKDNPNISVIMKCFTNGDYKRVAIRATKNYTETLAVKFND